MMGLKLGSVDRDSCLFHRYSAKINLKFGSVNGFLDLTVLFIKRKYLTGLRQQAFSILTELLTDKKSKLWLIKVVLEDPEGHY